MPYIERVVEALRAAPGPLTAHEIADAIDTAQPERPSEATLTTWLYAIAGSHDHPGVHRVAEAQRGRKRICWACDRRRSGGEDSH